MWCSVLCVVLDGVMWSVHASCGVVWCWVICVCRIVLFIVMCIVIRCVVSGRCCTVWVVCMCYVMWCDVMNGVVLHGVIGLSSFKYLSSFWSRAWNILVSLFKVVFFVIVGSATIKCSWDWWYIQLWLLFFKVMKKKRCRLKKRMKMQGNTQSISCCLFVVVGTALRGLMQLIRSSNSPLYGELLVSFWFRSAPVFPNLCQILVEVPWSSYCVKWAEILVHYDLTCLVLRQWFTQSVVNVLHNMTYFFLLSFRDSHKM